MANAEESPFEQREQEGEEGEGVVEQRDPARYEQIEVMQAPVLMQELWMGGMQDPRTADQKAGKVGGYCQNDGCGNWVSVDSIAAGGGCFYHTGEKTKGEWDRLREGSDEPFPGASRADTWSCCQKQDIQYHRVKRMPKRARGCEERSHTVEGFPSGQMIKPARS